MFQKSIYITRTLTFRDDANINFHTSMSYSSKISLMNEKIFLSPSPVFLLFSIKICIASTQRQSQRMYGVTKMHEYLSRHYLSYRTILLIQNLCGEILKERSFNPYNPSYFTRNRLPSAQDTSETNSEAIF